MFGTRFLLNTITAILAISFLSVFTPLDESNHTHSTSFYSQTDDPIVQNRLAFQNNWTTPDTTVVILNWSRLPNVIHISSLICKDLLQDVVEKVFIWNNNPQKLNEITMSDATGCPPGRLHIFNSPENLYFQARFVACAQATTPYCFIQDDDYLIWPEIIRTLRARVRAENSVNRIHLLPPHELLSNQLRTFRAGGNLHTSFAWLGYGTLLRKEEAVEFLELLRRLNFSDEQFKMADNYFSILSNTVPETWFDQGFELGGGQPFTVGEEGNSRNNRHITTALQVLSSVISSFQISNEPYLPFVSLANETPSPQVWRAPCKGLSCILSTTIQLLPPLIPATTLSEMLQVVNVGSINLGEAQAQHFRDFPLSQAVDGNWNTSFRSPYNAKEGEWLVVDMLGIPPENVKTLNFVFLVNKDTEQILRNCEFEWYSEKHGWAKMTDVIHCEDKYAPNRRRLQECSVELELGDSHRMSQHQPRLFKAQLTRSMDRGWAVNQIWIRSSQ